MDKDEFEAVRRLQHGRQRLDRDGLRAWLLGLEIEQPALCPVDTPDDDTANRIRGRISYYAKQHERHFKTFYRDAELWVMRDA